MGPDMASARGAGARAILAPTGRARVRVLALMVVLAVMAATAPALEALLFGPHDHVAATASTPGHPAVGAAQGEHSTSPHHRELSANPAERAEGGVIVCPMRFIATLADSSPLSPSHTSFGPLAPPRA